MGRCKKAKATFLSHYPRCYWCGVRLRWATATIDHHVPRAKGGTDARSNLRLCCSGCNSEKADRMPEEFWRDLCRGECRLGPIHPKRATRRVRPVADPGGQPRCICGKVKHPCRHSAEKCIEKMAARPGYSPGEGGELHVYLCRRSKTWHVGHVPKWMSKNKSDRPDPWWKAAAAPAQAAAT